MHFAKTCCDGDYCKAEESSEICELTLVHTWYPNLVTKSPHLNIKCIKLSSQDILYQYVLHHLHITAMSFHHLTTCHKKHLLHQCCCCHVIMIKQNKSEVCSRLSFIYYFSITLCISWHSVNTLFTQTGWLFTRNDRFQTRTERTIQSQKACASIF